MVRLGHKLLVTVLLLLGALSVPAHAEPITLKATLILASNESLPLDSRLDKVEYQLRRVFGFENYTHYGEATTVANVPSTVTMELGHGYRLELTLSPRRKGGITAEVRWLRGDVVLISTRVGMQRGVPAILGGPPHEGGNLIVSLEAQ